MLWGPFSTHRNFQTYLGYEVIRNKEFKEGCELLAKNSRVKIRHSFFLTGFTRYSFELL